MTDQDDEMIARLRRALEEEAAMVNPPDDGLSRIHQRTATGRPRWVPWAVAAAAVAVAGIGVAIGVNLGSHPGTTVASPGTSSAGSLSTSGSATPLLGGSSTPGAHGVIALPVYWLGEQGTNFRLYREFVPVPAAEVADPTAAVSRAVSLALSGTPTDTDYQTPWAPGSSATVEVSANQITIDLNQAATDGSRMGSQVASMAVQQLVWTATAALGSDVPVRITVNGRTPDLFGTVSLAQPFRRTSPSYEVLAAIWITDPQQGQRVTAPVTVAGQATVFEATVQWELRSGDQVRRSGTVMASEGGPGRGDWQVELGSLPAGTYTFRAYADSPAGNGSLQGEDTKTFTVG